MAADSLQLGTDRSRADAPSVELPASALLRHMMALGSSGSGKTVLCKVVVEEAVLAAIPAIVIDPQGDLSSLLLSGEQSALIDHGLDPAIAKRFHETLDLVVFTPGSSKGVPLCADPVPSDLTTLPKGEQAIAISRAASTIVALLGYELDSDDGSGLSAVMDRALSEMLASDQAPTATLDGLAAHLASQEKSGFASLTPFLPIKKIKTALQRLARLDVGARRRLFVDGVSLDIDVLLGRDISAAPPAGKTRVSVIHLNTLHTQEDKEFFVAALVDRLYAWMLQHPSKSLQALFYIDEVAPFIPPVQKPACKEGLVLLFKQARKYGLGCLMATQNPGDVDYKAMSQFGTWALGRVTTRQDLRKLEPTIKSLDPVASDAIVESLPSLKPGQFMLLSPDHFDAAVPLAVRWLYSDHQTLDEDRIEQIADERFRDRFVSLERGTHDARQVKASPKTPKATQPPPIAADTPVAPAPPSATVFAQPLSSALAADAEASEPTRIARPEKPHPEIVLHQHADRLASAASMSAKEFAAAAGTSEKSARDILKRLVDADLAKVFKEGRAHRYWAVRSGSRPDLGMPSVVLSVAPLIDKGHALAIAKSRLRTKLLGLVGQEEVVEDTRRVDRLLYRVDFEEHVDTSFLHRWVGASKDRRVGSVYVHPHRLSFLVFRPDRGISFVSAPGSVASEIEDLDGTAHFTEAAPATLAINEDDWTNRQTPDQVKLRFTETFSATPHRITPMFVPLWELILRSGQGSAYRIVTIDGLVGLDVDWNADTTRPSIL